MKKIFSLLVISVLSIGLVACTSTESTEQPTEEVKEVAKIELTTDQTKYIETTLKDMSIGTAYDGAEFILTIDKDALKVGVVKPIVDIMSYYKVNTSDATVKAIRNSLVFDDSFDIIKAESKDLKVDSMQVYIYNDIEAYDNNDFYTLKFMD